MPELNLVRPTVAYLKEKLSLTPEEEEIARYGLQMVIYPVAGFATISLAGWLAGCLESALVVALTAGVLRLFSGGAHARSPLTCNILGMVVAPVLGKVAAVTAPFLSLSRLALIIGLGFLVALAIIFRLAPVDSPA
uniref:Accessory regulator AgrB n=1 Tax=Ammonifex degensii TaxID=42838 RepID=A0A7C1F335_9THEO